VMHKISSVVGQVHPGAFYLASAIVLSLAVNTFTSAYGTVPAPVNQLGLLLCTLAALVSAVALSTLAWRIETIRLLAVERAHDAGVASGLLVSEAASAFWVEIVIKLAIGIVGAVMSVVFILTWR
jgi:hypothetical protein